MGEVASGKSAAINTFVTAMHDDSNVYRPALSLCLAEGSVTPFYMRYSVNPNSDIMLYDTWGIHGRTNYMDGSLQRILNGVMEDGFIEKSGAARIQWNETSETVAASAPKTSPKPHTAKSRRAIDMVVFCASALKPWAQFETARPSDYDILIRMAELMREIHERRGISLTYVGIAIKTVPFV